MHSPAAAELAALFFGSLLASTLLPGGVELALYAMVESGRHHQTALLIVATVGNTLGGLITYGMGALLRYGLRRARIPRGFGWLAARFRLSPAAQLRVQRWGVPSLLLSPLPIIGDPLCLAAGYLRLPFWACAAAIALGKFIRYWALLWLLD